MGAPLLANALRYELNAMLSLRPVAVKRHPARVLHRVSGVRVAPDLFLLARPRARIEDVVPFVLDGARLVEGEGRGGGELVEPGEGAAGLDDQLGVRGGAALLGFRGDARVEGGAPGIPDDVQGLRGLTAGGERPQSPWTSSGMPGA